MRVMSSYHSSFKYLDKKSDTDLGWIIAHFDPDNGEMDSYLSQEQVYSESYNGTKRTLYGTKYNAVANVKITVIKRDGSDFTLEECRKAYKWLTGNPEAEWMELYVGNEVKYRLLCTIQDVKPQKLDARTVGLNIYCESLSPWAYSHQITLPYSINGLETITINNESDDLYNPVYLKTIYKNTSGNLLKINNTTINEYTEVSGLAINETITLDNNMMITSDNPVKTFGNSFNFMWPRLRAGNNTLEITGSGELTFEYYYPIKMGDCAITLNAVSDPICSEDGTIQIDMLPWERISNKPSTLAGYNLTSDVADKYYNKKEIDNKFANISLDDVYTKKEVRNLISNATSEIYTKSEVENLVSGVANNIYTKTEVSDMLKDTVDDMYTKSEVDVMFDNIDMSAVDAYTKKEIDDKLANITAAGVDIDEDELNTMLASILI